MMVPGAMPLLALVDDVPDAPVGLAAPLPLDGFGAGGAGGNGGCGRGAGGVGRQGV